MLTVPQEIKDLLHQDTCPKNIRIHFPNMERTDICNDMIVKDSVSFTESLCSQDTLKFGLCESPVFECEVVGVENIKGMTIQVFCEVYCDSTVEDAEWKVDIQKYVYSIPYGTFVVNEATRQADMQHRKIVGYSFLYYKENLSAGLSVGDYRSEGVDPSSSPYVVPIETFVYEKYPEFFDMSAYEVTPYNINGGTTSDFFRTLLVWPESENYVYMLRAERYQFGSTIYYPTVFNTNDFNVDENLMTNLQNILDVSINTYGLPETDLDSFLEVLDKYNIYPPRARVNRDLPGNQDINMYGKIYTSKRINFSAGRMTFSIVKARKSTQQIISTEYSFGWIQILNASSYITAYRVDNINANITLSLPKERVTGYIQIWPYDGYSYKKAYDQVDSIKLFNDVLELQGLMGAYSREGIRLINIKKLFLLNPDENLYPGTEVYPQGVKGGKLLPKDYQTCWYNDDYTLPFGAIYCTFKTMQNDQQIDGEYTLFLNGFDINSDPEKYRIYKIENNGAIDSKTWTIEEIEDICQTIANNLEGVTYMPVDFVGRGLPYVEAGDTFEILTRSNDSITTIVLNRTISGEQVLTDSYKSV